MFHVEAKHGDTNRLSAIPSCYDKSSAAHTSTVDDTKYIATKSLDVRTCRSVWCWDGTHYVQVNVSRTLGPDSVIRQVDEDVILPVKEFLRMEFSLTEAYEETVKKIIQFNNKCCRPIEDPTTARSLEHRSSNATIDLIHSSYNFVLNGLQSYFSACIPKKRKSSRWPNSTCPRRPVLPPNSSTEAIISGNEHRSMIEVIKYHEKSHSEEDLKYRTSTEDVPPPTQAPRLDHFELSSNSYTSLPESVIGVVAVEFFYSTCKGVIGCRVLGVTQSDTVILLQSVELGALIKRERIVRQLRDLLGELTYKQLQLFEQERCVISGPVYCGVLPEILPFGIERGVSLQECSPVIQAQVHLVLNL